MEFEESKERMLGIDCPPGEPRPGHFLPEVIAGTGLPKRKADVKLMGMWFWHFDGVDDEIWERAVRVVGPRLRSLHRRRLIRGASLSGFDFGGSIEPEVLV